MDDVAVAELRGLVAVTPGLAEILSGILDRRERRGKLPGRLTVAIPPACASALRAILSSRAVVDLGDGRSRLDLSRAEAAVGSAVALESILYRVVGREPRDPAAEESLLRREVAAGLFDLAGLASTQASQRYLAAEKDAVLRGGGELLGLAREQGKAFVLAEARTIVTCVDAALRNESPVRLANFAARVLGDSKALAGFSAGGSDRLRRVGAALYFHDEATAREVHFLGEPTSFRDACIRALEVHGITRDEAAVSVLCFGPLTYVKEGERFDQVARHALLGDPCRLTLAQLRGAQLEELPVHAVTIIENQTSFLDYVDVLVSRTDLPRELVVLSEGQASWAVVTLLRLCAAQRLPMRHAGDLDRSGVLILRSLRHRVGARIEPVAMDVATHRRFAGRGRRVGADEAARLDALVKVEDPLKAEVGHELLCEIQRTGIWIEQESFAHEALIPGLAGHTSS